MKTLAFSPCPNDTYIFGAWANHLVAPDLKMNVELLDIEELNIALRRGQFDVQKVSAITALQCLEEYEILPVGGAIAYGVGPVVVTKKGKNVSLNELSGKKVAFPGAGTTAHFLFQLFGPVDIQPVFTRFDKIISMVQKGEVDAGVLIHEGRFIVEKENLCTVADLGALWEEREGLPLPLGVVVAKRSLVEKPAVVEAIHHSLQFASTHLEQVYPYILEHAQNKDPDVIGKHISSFVNEESAGLDRIWSKSPSKILRKRQRNGPLPFRGKSLSPQSRSHLKTYYFAKRLEC